MIHNKAFTNSTCVCMGWLYNQVYSVEHYDESRICHAAGQEIFILHFVKACWAHCLNNRLAEIKIQLLQNMSKSKTWATDPPAPFAPGFPFQKRSTCSNVPSGDQNSIVQRHYSCMIQIRVKRTDQTSKWFLLPKKVQIFL